MSAKFALTLPFATVILTRSRPISSAPWSLSGAQPNSACDGVLASQQKMGTIEGDSIRQNADPHSVQHFVRNTLSV